jgi:ABC-type transport system involved in multi-copper enzyme maturation permease subunit
MALMPFLAILRHELRGLTASWLVRLWFGASALWTLLAMAASWEGLDRAPLIAVLLAPYLVFPWFIVVMLLGIGPITGSRLDSLADGILSRPVTRYEYLLASWAARVSLVLAVFLLVIVPAICLVVFAERPSSNDSVTFYGILASLIVVSLVMTFLVSLGFFAGTLLRSPLLAAVVLVLFWMPINVVLHQFSLEEISPLSLTQALPKLLQTPWRETQEEEGVTTQEDLEAAAMQAARSLMMFAGAQPEPPQRDGFFAQGEGRYDDFSLTRVLLGYGLPTLATLGLALLCFCWRDL